MTPDFRALCAELVAWADKTSAHYYTPPEVLARARAALAAPAPEGPTVMEIIEFADEIEAAELGQVDLVRAALARWGHQPAPPAAGEQRHPTPVPVAERLPEPEDCDAGGRCWAWDWLAEKWCLCDRTSACHGFDHWLPATALPLPAGEVEPNAE